ncbi:MAG: hypothetical protein RJB13_1954 [Pseudomonadota bacterium]
MRLCSALFALFVLTACSGATEFLGENPSSLKPVTLEPATNGTPVPPVPVIGSYLAGTLFSESGETVARAEIEVPLWSAVVRTDRNGGFTIPVSSSPASDVEVRIRGADSIGEMRLMATVPVEVVDLMNEAVNLGNVASLLSRTVAMVLPNQSSLSQTQTADGVVLSGRLLMHSFPRELDVRKYTHLPFFSGTTDLNSALLQWRKPLGRLGVIRLGFASRPSTLGVWDGRLDEQFIAAGGQVITDFSDCSDSFRSLDAGPLESVESALCAVLLSQSESYFRLAYVGDTFTALSNIILLHGEAPIEKRVYDFSGQPQIYKLHRTPTEDRPLVIVAWGGGGASGRGGALGGAGGYTQLKITSGMLRGDELTVYVGGSGQLGTGLRSGGGGGGASAVLRNGQVVIVAAGGGGAAGEGTAGGGGAGGGIIGAQGGADGCAGGAGGGGAQADGVNGLGGVSNRGYGVGLAGSAGHGGSGGSDGTADLSTAGAGGWGWKNGGISGVSTSDGGGGGGGAGFGGGGGGGAGCHGMGGGGGSSFIDSAFGAGDVLSGQGALPAKRNDADNGGRGAAAFPGRVVITL